MSNKELLVVMKNKKREYEKEGIKIMKKNFLKILAVAVVVIGIPIGIWSSIAVSTQWWGQWSVIGDPRAIHWHFAIGVWLAFALVGLFMWYMHMLFVQRNLDRQKYMRTSVIILIVGIITSLLLGYRRWEPNPWSPSGWGGADVEIPSSFDVVFVIVFFIAFVAMATALFVMSLRKCKGGNK